MTKRLTSIDDLNALRDKARAEIDLRHGAKETRVTVHLGTCGIAAGGREILATLVSEIASLGARNVSIRQTGCVGLCEMEPMITVTGKNGVTHRYGRLDRAKTREIVQRHLLQGTPVNEHLIKD